MMHVCNRNDKTVQGKTVFFNISPVTNVENKAASAVSYLQAFVNTLLGYV